MLTTLPLCQTIVVIDELGLPYLLLAIHFTYITFSTEELHSDPTAAMSGIIYFLY